jgi:hypothetical protein
MKMKKKTCKRGKRVLARIKWWDKNDGNGIATAVDGTEYYIDSSSMALKYTPRDSDFIFLFENLSITHTRCGLDVLPTGVTELTKCEFQIASSLRCAQAQLQSVQRQILHLRRVRLGKV